MDQIKVTVVYAGDLQDARQIDGKIWFAVDGEAVLTREMSITRHRQESQVSPGPNVTASIHVVPRFPSTSTTSISPTETGRTQPNKHNQLLIKAAQQTNPTFAPATSLPPGVHIMCHVEPPSEDEAENPAYATATVPTSNTWSALWDDLKAGAGATEEAERLKWQRPCLELMDQVAVYLDSEAIAGVIRSSVPADGGWALVPCEPKSGLVCLVASGRSGVGGKVAWFHVGSEEAEDGAAVAVPDSLLFASAVKAEPAYASARAHVGERGNIKVATEAHRVLPGGSLSGYDLSSTRPRNNVERTDSEVDPRADEGAEAAGMRVDDAVFVDAALSPRVDGPGGWRGTVSVEELPGGGLHRHVRVKINIRCDGHICDEDLGESGSDDNSNHEWCELLLSQHVPKGAYIDVDEVKARHDFDILSSLPTRPRVGVDTFGGVPIDIELPASVSGQHLVNFSVWVGLPVGEREEAGISAELTLPVHLRYPDPGCERRAEECEEYAWVEVAPPLASIRCGSAGKVGSFTPVLPSLPPLGIALSVPRGLAWHRDLVVWGTIGAAALGTLYTVYTLCSTLLAESVRNRSRKNRSKKAHLE